MSATPITLAPVQTMKVIYGLQGFEGEFCAIGRDLTLSAMDAPTFLPSGSQMAYEIHGGRKVLMERLTVRGKQWLMTAGGDHV